MTEYTLITGATSGIGYALAKEFAGRGHHLILASRNLARMEEIKRDFAARRPGQEVVCLQTDLSLHDAPEELFDRCRDLAVTVLVNNAGVVLETGRQIDHGLQDSMGMLRLNCTAVMKLCTLFGKAMCARRSGYILNVASTAAFQPMPFTALYGASKAFVLSLSEAMHLELEDCGVGVTALCPGLTDTGLFKGGKPNVPGWIYKMVSPELTARCAVEAMYRKKLYVVPYFQHWLIVHVARFLPRSAVARVMRHIGKVRHKVRFI
ncbi:MAG: SDR family oxidoreductase [Acidobacteriota bacterium]|jgi:short-subunit dehydrogenase|nr:SDR family oxidoreductase [Acidobacteriota bacterium]